MKRTRAIILKEICDEILKIVEHAADPTMKSVALVEYKAAQTELRRHLEANARDVIVYKLRELRRELHSAEK